MLPAPVTAVVTPLTEATGLASWAWLLIAVPAASAAFLLLAGIIYMLVRPYKEATTLKA